MRIPATITIAASTTISAAADVGPDNNIYGVEMPTAWTAGNITFQVSNDGTTFQLLVDDAHNTVTLTTPGASETVMFRDTIAMSLGNFRFIKLVSQNAQAADRALFLLVRCSD